MNELIKLLADELMGDNASSSTLLAAWRIDVLARHFGLETPDWLRALSNGNLEKADAVIEEARAEMKAGVE